MLIPENSFNLVVTDVKGIKSVFELIQALKEDKIRLTLTHSDKHEVTFKIKHSSAYTHKTIEQWFSDIAQSEVYTGLKPASIALSLPSTGLVTASLSFMGKNLERTGTTQYFTSPAATNTEGIFAAVSGAVIVNGQPVGLITSMDLSISRNQEAANVVGSNNSQPNSSGYVIAPFSSIVTIIRLAHLLNTVNVFVALSTNFHCQ